MDRWVMYAGEFVSKGRHLVRCEIWRDCTDGEIPGEIGELTFTGDSSPLTIEWGDTDKFEVLHGSTATLVIESPGDRTYTRLYTTRPGEIGLDVYVDGEFWWRGVLDPEQYEEPYERARNYDVELNFSDFGQLGRMSFDFDKELYPVQSVAEYVTSGLRSVGQLMPTGAFDASMVTTADSSGATGRALLDRMQVASANFYDEYGEPMNWDEVIEGVLLPLGIHVKQRSGKIWLYDLEGLRDGSTDEIWWSGASQTLGVDRVGNRVRVSFSPYGDKTLYDGSIDEGDVLQDAEGAQINTDLNIGADDIARNTVEGFKFYYGPTDGVELPFEPKAGSLFRIESQASGTDCAGLCLVASRYYYALDRDKAYYVGWPHDIDLDSARVNVAGPTLFSTGAGTPEWLTAQASGLSVGSKRRMLRVSLSMLMSAKYNPFETEDSYNYKELQNKWAQHVRWAYMPCKLEAHLYNGMVLYYRNVDRIRAWHNEDFTGNAQGNRWSWGEWTSVDPGPGGLLLGYYSKSKPGDECAFDGWTQNRQAYGMNKKIPRRAESLSDGEYIELPWMPIARLVLRVYRGALLYTGKCKKPDGKFGDHGYKIVQWWMVKDPKIEVVDEFGRDLNDQDVEYVGELDGNASEEIGLDTVCGTLTDKVLPTSRGVYRYRDGSAVSELSRGGVTDCMEELLIGSVYSQMAHRKTKLSGEARLREGKEMALTEANQGSLRFYVSGEVADLAEWTDEVTMVELGRERYEKSK